jgi:hypothetical protein
MRCVCRVAVSTLLLISGILWLAAVAQRWWPDCKLGQFDEPACLWAQSYPYERFQGSEPWTPIAHTAQLEGSSMLCLAFAIAVLPWLWAPRRISPSLAVLVPAACVGLLGAGTWALGPSGSAEAAAAAGGAPVTAIVWVLGLPGFLLAAAASAHTKEAPAGTNRWRLVVACLIGLSNPLAAYFIGPMFTGYMSHDDPPWSGVVSTVLLVAAAAFVWPSSRALAHVDRRHTPRARPWAGEPAAR